MTMCKVGACLAACVLPWQMLGQMVIEAEQMLGPGRSIDRSAASEARTRRVAPGDTITASFSVPGATSVELMMTCSNDSYVGRPLERVVVALDGVDVGLPTVCPDTSMAGQPGAGWNVFRTVVVGAFALSAGTHTLAARVLPPTDSYDVEIDKFSLVPISAPSAPAIVVIAGPRVSSPAGGRAQRLESTALCTESHPSLVGGGCSISGSAGLHLRTTAPSEPSGWFCSWGTQEDTVGLVDAVGQAHALCLRGR